MFQITELEFFLMVMLLSVLEYLPEVLSARFSFDFLE